MDITQWGGVAAVIASPAATLILAFFVWKMQEEIRDMKKALSGEGDNAFVKRRDMARELVIAKGAHDRYEADIEDLQRETARLERDKLSVRDYEREKQQRLRGR